MPEHKVRYFTAADLAETLYRGLAGNSAGRVIENLLRNDLLLVDEVGFAPLDDTGAQLLFRFVSAAYERRALGMASHWPFDQWGRFLPEHTTAVSLLDRLLHHANVVITDAESFRMRQARARGGTVQQQPHSRHRSPRTALVTGSFPHARNPGQPERAEVVISWSGRPYSAD